MSSLPTPCERIPTIPGVAVACRPVIAGDEDALTMEENASLGDCVLAVRRRAAAARLAARELLAEAGWPGWRMPRIDGQPPRWPAGICGSLSHSDTLAAAALARRGAWLGVGIDLEPGEPIDRDVLDLIATAEEARFVKHDLLIGKVLFCAKEAAYKAMFSVDKRFLEPHEIVVDLRSNTATALSGRRAMLAVHVDHRILVVGVVPG